MTERTEDFVIVARYMPGGGVEGWVVRETPVVGTYEEAGKTASLIARALDRDFGDSHFWTVDLYKQGREHGSYYQLFHGRLS